MTSFTEKRCGSSLSSWLIVDTLLISKLFTPFVPICSQFRLYICWENSLGEFVKNKTHRFQCFSANGVIIKRVCGVLAWLFYNVVHGEVFSNIAHSQVMLYFNECNLSVPEANLTKIRKLPIPNLSDKRLGVTTVLFVLLPKRGIFLAFWLGQRNMAVKG